MLRPVLLMAFDPAQHHRRSIRLPGYDYSESGLYFITVCTWQRRCLLSTTENGTVNLTPAGETVQSTWMALPRRFPGLGLDAFVVMPNHIHGILVLDRTGVPRGLRVASLGQIVRAFKSISAIAANRVLGTEGRPFWQRNYYEHIVRRGKDLDEIRRYIEMNPWKWAEDPENPEFRGKA